MELLCTNAFGYHVPGDVIFVPDDTENFDTSYFEKVVKVDKTSKPETKNDNVPEKVPTDDVPVKVPTEVTQKGN